MTEVWIRPNQRALALGWIVPLMLLQLALVLVMLGIRSGNWGWHIAAAVPAGVAPFLMATLWRMMRQPRLAYQDGQLLLYFGLADPLTVPIDVVECFFHGQAGGMIPDAAGREAEVRTVIVRLAEAAKEWHHRDVKPALGQWCEGYITIRGTWCEPITPDMLRRLNARLVEVQRERKGYHAGAIG